MPSILKNRGRNLLSTTQKSKNCSTSKRSKKNKRGRKKERWRRNESVTMKSRRSRSQSTNKRRQSLLIYLPMLIQTTTMKSTEMTSEVLKVMPVNTLTRCCSSISSALNKTLITRKTSCIWPLHKIIIQWVQEDKKGHHQLLCEKIRH